MILCVFYLPILCPAGCICPHVWGNPSSFQLKVSVLQFSLHSPARFPKIAIAENSDKMVAFSYHSLGLEFSCKNRYHSSAVSILYFTDFLNLAPCKIHLEGRLYCIGKGMGCNFFISFKIRYHLSVSWAPWEALFTLLCINQSQILGSDLRETLFPGG